MAKSSGSSTSKGNPAHKRMSNEKLKLRRARSWARGQARKVRAIAAQKALETLNRQRRNEGRATPWEVACAARNEKRRPLQEAYAKRRKESVLSAS